MTTADEAVRDDFFDALLGDFLDEAGELLDRLNEKLLQLDQWVADLGDGQRQSCDADLMNEMFRAAHSLKGLSAMLGLNEINHLTHKVENLFDAARQETLFVTSEAVELLFQAHDRLSDMVQALSSETPVETKCDDVLDRIESLLVEAGVERSRSSQENAEQALQELMATPDDGDHGETTPLCLTEEAPASPEKPTASNVDQLEGVVDEADIPSKYLSIFIDETEEAVDSLTETLLAQECEIDSIAADSLLILSHRIKGSAASVGLNRVATFAHFMEDLLQKQREGDVQLTADMTDVLLKCTDALRTYVGGLKSGAADSSNFSELCNELLRLQEPPKEQPDSTDETEDAGALPYDADKRAEITADVRGVIFESAPENAKGYLGRVFFQPDFPLIGMKARLIYEKLAQIGKVFHCLPVPDSLDELEELSLLDFGVETECEQAALEEQLQIVSVTAVVVEPLPSPSAPATAPSTETAPPETRTPVQDTANKTPSAAKAAAPPAPANSNGGGAARGSEPSARPTETLRVDIERLDQLMNLAGQLVINKARFARIDDSLRHAVGTSRSSKSLRNSFGAFDKIHEALNECEHSKENQRQLGSIRSHVRVIQNDLETVCREIEKLTKARATVADLSEAVHQLERVSDGIQRSVMDTRMVPIGPLFARFRRVIRDITRGNGKEIALNIRGEKTELDKRMIDELGDPLIHMVRNSADHGVELPSDRIAAGKPREGTITLDAYHRGNSIIVQVTDDGRGIDPEKIKTKAIQRELVSAADAERLTTHQIHNLIWEAGFTTAEQVTEISGRGMGMDIVRSKIEEINGTVELESVHGEGTVFTIKLPLTLAILPSLMAEIYGDVYALPIESVVEIVSVSCDDLSTVHGLPNARVRGRVVPIVHLDEVFQFHDTGSREISQSNSQDKTLVIIGNEGDEIGLAVDRLLGEEDIVIKSLAENYRNVHGIAGASILGDGRVSLILDTAALVDTSSQTGLTLHHHEELA